MELMRAPDRTWLNQALDRLDADRARTTETSLFNFPLPEDWNIGLYLKDESAHPTGSLKHRLARALIEFALVNGWIDAETTLVESSSGSTAVSEAYFAKLLGLPFIAVVPENTSPSKLKLIEFYGGTCHFATASSECSKIAQELAQSINGYFVNQFRFASIVSDWTSRSSLASAVYSQMERERHPLPTWIVAGAGTGGTSASIGRFIRRNKYPTQLLVVDPENSVFYDAWQHGGSPTIPASSRIEGIGRSQVELSFEPGVIDAMIKVDDSASISAMLYLREVLGISAGASTGTNLWGALKVVNAMRNAGQEGSVVTLICDRGNRYKETYYNPEWLKREGLDSTEPRNAIRRFINGGDLD